MISNIKLGSLLTALNNAEILEFERFVVSPFFYNGTQYGDLPALLRYILGKVQEPVAGQTPFERQEAFAVTYPDQRFVDGKLEKSLSALHQLLKRYVTIRQQELSGAEFDGLLYQLAFYRERRLKNRFENLRDPMVEHPDLKGSASQHTLRRQFMFDYEICNFELYFNSKKAYASMPVAMESLEASYLLSKLELINQYLMARRITRFEVPEEVAELMYKGHFPEQVINKHPILLIAYKIFRLLEQEQPSVAEFEELQQLIENHTNEVDHEYIRAYLTYLRNLCTLLVNDNQISFLPVLFNLSKEHYQRGYLHYEGKIHGTTLISVSHNALRLNEIKWAEMFVLNHENKVLSDTPENDYYHLAKANLLFHQKKYDDATSLIPDGFNSADLTLLCRRLEMKCYYEMQSTMLDYKIDTFRMFLSRTGKDLLPALLKRRNGNFVNLLARIVTTPKGDRQRAQKLKEAALSQAEIVERDWLVEIIDRLR